MCVLLLGLIQTMANNLKIKKKFASVINTEWGSKVTTRKTGVKASELAWDWGYMRVR
jgi:hypothetical protein